VLIKYFLPKGLVFLTDIVEYTYTLHDRYNQYGGIKYDLNASVKQLQALQKTKFFVLRLLVSA